MTAAAKPQPEIAGEILLIDPAEINPDVPGRIGQFFPLKAEGLARRIDTDGQLEPIWVAKAPAKSKFKWDLVAGRHRHHACMSLGRHIEARVFSGNKEALRKLQASENLDRRRMTVLEDAMFVAAVAEIAQARVLAAHGVDSIQALGAARTNAADKSVQSALRDDGKAHFAHPGLVGDELVAADAAAEVTLEGLAGTYRWKPEVAAACGMDEKKVQRALRIHRQLVVPFPELVEALKEHPVADNASALLKLAALPKEGREAALQALAAGDEHPAPSDETQPIDQGKKVYERALQVLKRLSDTEHEALIESRVQSLGIVSKRRIFEQLQSELNKGGKA